MKLADSVMAGKASDGSIKWQLCYDISARTWWMVSWQPGLPFFFFPFPPLFYFPSLFDKMSQTSHSSNSHLIFFTLFSGAASHCFLLPPSLSLPLCKLEFPGWLALVFYGTVFGVWGFSYYGCYY